MIPTFQRETYLEKTLQSVLEASVQASSMEICVVDNCSPSQAIADLVERVGRGRIRFVKNATNLGMFENWNQCIRLARGEWIHILHDDDMVLPGFYRNYEALMQAHPGAGLIASPAIFINEKSEPISASRPGWRESGEWIDAPQNLVARNCFLCPTVVVKRFVYEQVGGFRTDLRFASDWEMWTRIANEGNSVAATLRAEALYRLHSGSESSALFKDGIYVREAAALENYFAMKYQKRSKTPIHAFACHLGIVAAITSAYRGHPEGAFRQMGHVCQLRPSAKHRLLRVLFPVVAAVVGIAPRWLVEGLQQLISQRRLRRSMRTTE